MGWELLSWWGRHTDSTCSPERTICKSNSTGLIDSNESKFAQFHEQVEILVIELMSCVVKDLRLGSSGRSLIVLFCEPDCFSD